MSPPFTTPLLAQVQLPAPSPGEAPFRPRPDDPLATVGLALLAYGVVQLLARVVDRLPFGRGDAAPPQGVFTAEDRARLERVLETVTAGRDGVERLGETLDAVHEQTRWLAELRVRVDVRDGEPLWRCRAAAVADQAALNQRLIGQTLDEVRATNTRLDGVLRKLRALWLRVGRRKNDRR